MRVFVIVGVLLALLAIPANAGVYSYQCGDDIIFVIEWPNRYEILLRDPKTGNDNKIRPENKGIKFNPKSYALSKDGKACVSGSYEH